jgi:hypothetical protein
MGKCEGVPVLKQAPCHEDVCGRGPTAPRILTSALDAGEQSASSSGRFTPRGKSYRYPLDEVWVGTRAGLDAVAKRKENPFSAPTGNLSPVLHPVA